MFKEIVKNLTKKTFGTAAQGAASIGNTMLDGAIQGLSERSPLVGKALANKVNTARITKQVTSKFLDSSTNTDFGEEVKKELGEDTSQKDLKKKMASILEQLTKDVKNQSVAELKTNDLYQKYSKHFDDYKSKVNRALVESKKQKETESGINTGVEDTGLDSDAVVDKLENIEANTKELVDKFDSTQDKENLPGAVITKETPAISPVKQDLNLSEISPEMAREPSVTESISKPIVQKVEPVSQKVVSATLNSESNIETPTGAVESAKTDSVSNFEETLKTFEKTEEAQSNTEQQLLTEAKESNVFLKQIVENYEMAKADADEAATESLRVTPVKGNSAAKALQEQNSDVKKNSDKPSLVDKLLSRNGHRPKTTKLPGPGLLARALPLAAGAAAVGAAGFAGYKAGEWLNENTNIQSGIADGIDTVKGWFGNSDSDKIKESEQKAAQNLYEKNVKEGRLTSKSADFLEKQGVKVDRSKIVVLPEAAKSSVISDVSKEVETKDKLQAEKSTTPAAPVLLNNTTNNISGGGSSSPTIISGMNIRNSESTFDRVQMQNYWSRTA